MKKILIFVFILTCCYNVSYAQSVIEQELRIKKTEIETQIDRGAIYIKYVDKYFTINIHQSEKLELLLEHIWEIRRTLWKTQSDDDTKLLIDYIECKIMLILGSQYWKKIQQDPPKLLLEFNDKQLWIYLFSLTDKELDELVALLYTSQQLQEVEKIYLGYISEAKDSKILSDIRSLASSIEIELTYNSHKWMIIWLQAYDYSSGDITWKTGYPNYDILYGNRKSWLDSYWYEYQIAYYNDGVNTYYQVLGFTWSDSTSLTANIIWNYQGSSPSSLFPNYLDWEKYNLQERKYTSTPVSENELYTSAIYYYYLENNPAILEEQQKDLRNITRVSVLLSIQSVIETYYSKNWEYPSTSDVSNVIKTSLWNIPKDEIQWKTSNSCLFWYYYEVWDIKHSITWEIIKNQRYRLSSCREWKEKIIRSTYEDGNGIFDTKILIE